MSSGKKIWILTVQGRNSFECSIPGNPGILHEGGTSVHQVFADFFVVSEIAALCKNLGVTLTSRILGGDENPVERSKLFQRPEEIIVPFQECLECPWWDPVTLGEEKSCFLREAPPESARVLLETSPKHVEAAKKCPQGEV